MDLGAVKVWVGKQNYVLSLIWGTFSRRKRMCHPKCIFTLRLVAARLHDQAATSKGVQRAGESLFFPLLVAILWSRAVTLDIILISVRKLTLSITSLVVMWSDVWQNSLSSFLPFSPSSLSSLLISGAGNRSHGSSDVTQLSNSQLKAVQFTSSAARCKWPS